MINWLHSTLENEGFALCNELFSFAKVALKKKALVDDWFAEERYQTLMDCLSSNFQHMDLSEAKKLLVGGLAFLCQYDRKTSKDTVWSVIYDLNNKRVYRCGEQS